MSGTLPRNGRAESGAAGTPRGVALRGELPCRRPARGWRCRDGGGAEEVRREREVERDRDCPGTAARRDAGSSCAAAARSRPMPGIPALGTCPMSGTLPEELLAGGVGVEDETEAVARSEEHT